MSLTLSGGTPQCARKRKEGTDRRSFASLEDEPGLAARLVAVGSGLSAQPQEGQSIRYVTPVRSRTGLGYLILSSRCVHFGHGCLVW
jgi:hypothetical protein